MSNLANQNAGERHTCALAMKMAAVEPVSTACLCFVFPWLIEYYNTAYAIHIAYAFLQPIFFQTRPILPWFSILFIDNACETCWKWQCLRFEPLTWSLWTHINLQTFTRHSRKGILCSLGHPLVTSEDAFVLYSNWFYSDYSCFAPWHSEVYSESVGGKKRNTMFCILLRFLCTVTI